MTSDYSPDSPATDPTGRVVRPTATAGLMLSGRYRLEALLASTGGIMTWRATDNVLSRPVLMHLLPPDDERMGWVLNAARKAATITDARFLRVLDALEATGQEPWSFVVSEFAVGDSLQTLLGNGPVSGEQASYIVGQMASALAPLHARGMFHLRISPSSVIITVNGNIKIVGFLIDAALRRIESGDYGYCEITGEPISLQRLEARPIATMTLEAQERHEREERISRDD